MLNRQLLLLILLLPACQALRPATPPPGAWLAGDFHNHTVLTDGGLQAGEVLARGFGFGLDWMANSEHGGAFARNPQGQTWPPGTVFMGSPPVAKMWRWQSLWQESTPLIEKARRDYPAKLLLQGYEWNVPSHDHASVAIIEPAADGGRALARHEYLFGANDSGTTSDGPLEVSGKRLINDHDKALAGVAWLADNSPDSSYCLLNHPSRRRAYSIADLRDLNNAAPRVVFGMEGVPGHQKAGQRGAYGRGEGVSSLAATYGGADVMIAKVGGTWDALLGEGRRFFIFANSDFHQPQADFWPGEYAKSLTHVCDSDRDGSYSPAELLAGLRSGNSFIVLGDLLRGLSFTVQRGGQTVGMGGTLAGGGGEVRIDIRLRVGGVNQHGDRVKVDHLDLIAGEVSGVVSRYLADGVSPNPAYARDGNATAKVIATFTAQDWRDDGDGWLSMVYRLPEVRQASYFRLRGTNLGRGVAGETDGEGNPLSDTLMAPNTEAKAYADLWFYSNPVFVSAGGG